MRPRVLSRNSTLPNLHLRTSELQHLYGRSNPTRGDIQSFSDYISKVDEPALRVATLPVSEIPTRG